MDLKDKVALVVGGAGGIGLGIAQALASEGCKVAVADCSEAALQKATGEGPLQGRLCDVTDRRQVAALFDWLAQEVGSIDVLVNSAGINVGNRMMANIDPADFDKIMQANTTATFNCIGAPARAKTPNRIGQHHRPMVKHF